MDPEAREKLHAAGRIAKAAREFGAPLVRDGVRLLDVCEAIEGKIRELGAKPAFPTCASVDHVAAHYTPTHDDPLAFLRGNVVKLDLGARIDGYIADTAVTVEVGTRNWTNLIRASEVALDAAIEVCRPGTPTRLIGAAIERAIESFGYRPISNLTGHSIEPYTLHAGKAVPNVGDHGHDVVEAGDTIAIEPFSSSGAGKVHGRKTGNIYRLLRAGPSTPASTAEFLRRAELEFRTLPFAERWAYRLDPRGPQHLQRLLRSGLAMTYEALLDVGKGIVAQTEHTLIVGEDRVEVTTG